MKSFRQTLLAVLLTLTCSVPLLAEDWPRFRGADGSGATSATGLPVTWSDTKNVAWKTPLPGFGASSAIVVGDKLFVACYSGYGQGVGNEGEKKDLRLHIVCVDKKTGKVIWDKSAAADEDVKTYRGFIALHGYASSTPASDGQAVFGFFGPNGVFAYDMEGKLLWRKKLGSKTHGFGTANSPVLLGDMVLVNASVESGTLYALNKKTGDIVWEAGGIQSSWNTPLVVRAKNGRQEIVLNTKGKIRSFNPANGKELWNCEAIDDYICPSVIAHEGIVYAIGGRSATCVAVAAGGLGEVKPLWRTKAGSNVSSPVYRDGKLLWVSDKGIAYCLDAKTGKELKGQRIEGTGRVYASVLLAEGLLYAVSREKGTWVLSADEQFRKIAHNEFESDTSIFNASPVVSDGKMYLRSDKYLYCLAK